MNLENEKIYSSVYVKVELLSIEWRKECSINNRCTQQRFQLNSNIFGTHEFHRIDYSIYSKHITKQIFLNSYYKNFHPYDLIISSKVIGYDEFFQIPIDCDESTPVFAYKNLQQSGENDEALLVLVGKCYTAHVSVKYFLDNNSLECNNNETKGISAALTLKNYFGTNYNNLVIILITLIIIFSLSSIILLILITFHCHKIMKYRRMKRLIYPISSLPFTNSDKISDCQTNISNNKHLINRSTIISKQNNLDLQNEVLYTNYQSNKILIKDNISTNCEKMESVNDWIVSKNSGTTYLSDYESFRQNSSNNIDDDNLSTASTSLFGGASGSNPGIIV